MKTQRKSIELLILLTSIFCSCSGTQKENTNHQNIDGIYLSFSNGRAFIKDNDSLRITVRTEGNIDSLNYSISKTVEGKVSNAGLICLPLSDLPLGYHSIVVSHKTTSARLSFTLLPSAPPKKLEYSIVNTFPHSIESYTQGLVYDNGILLESTGLHGKSTLQSVIIESATPIKTISLENSYFGEGLAMVGNKLFQLTWQSQKGFIYDKTSLSKIGEFSYQTEGWGLCFDGQHLILSDGTQYLYFLDTASLKVISQLPVFDNLGPVAQLNELEYVHGQIFANVYMTNSIVRIDPSSGAVTGKLDCYGLLKSKYRHPSIDVLNGIAYNQENNHYYITGKNWPVLFEVEIVE